MYGCCEFVRKVKTTKKHMIFVFFSKIQYGVENSKKAELLAESRNANSLTRLQLVPHCSLSTTEAGIRHIEKHTNKSK